MATAVMMRSIRSRRIASLLYAAAAIAVATLIANYAVVFACSWNATLGGVNPNSAPPGARVTVSGNAFAAGPVDVRWGTDTGPVLAHTAGPDFAVDMTVPGAAPAWYYIIVTGYNPDGSVAARRSATFHVTAPVVTATPSSAPTPSPLPSTLPTAPPAQGASGAGAQPAGSQPGSTQGVPVKATHPAARTPQQVGGATAASSVAGAVAATAPSAAVGPAAGLSSPATGQSSGPQANAQPAIPEPVTGDLWPGFAPGRPGASLSDAADANAGHGTVLVVVLGLVAGGVALFGMLATVTVGRARTRRGRRPSTRSSE